MERITSYVLRNRKYILGVTRYLNVEQLNQVPDGFNNSIIWNIGHMTASLLELFYLMTENKLKVEEKYHVNFRIGTGPSWIDEIEIGKLKQLFLQTVSQLEVDYRQGLFQQYDSIADTDPNAPRLSDLTNHLLFHEGLHYNNIMSLRRVILMSEGYQV